jgi:hypothetical protein
MSAMPVQHKLKYVVELDTGIDVQPFEYINSGGNSGTIVSSFHEIPESSGGKSVDSACLRPPFY